MLMFVAVIVGAVTLWRLNAPSLRISGAVEPISSADDGAIYKNALIAEIRQSDRVLVEEHAWLADKNGSYDLYNQKVYASHELDASQKVALLTSIESMESTIPEYARGCALVPHHAIRFYSSNRLRGIMEICFACGDIVWEHAPGTTPIALIDVLEKLIKDAGFEPRRDWDAYEAQRP